MNKSGANSQTGQTVLSHIHDPELRCAALCKALLHSGTISDFSAQMHIYEIYVETSLPKLIFFRGTFFASLMEANGKVHTLAGASVTKVEKKVALIKL